MLDDFEAQAVLLGPRSCFRSPYTRARWMALLPLINSTTCDTAYFGGMAIVMCPWSASRWPSSIRLSFCSASLRDFAQMLSQVAVQPLPPAFGDKHYVIFALPLGVA